MLESGTVDAQESVKQFLNGHFATLESLELVNELLRDEEETNALLEEELKAAQKTTQALHQEASVIAENVRAESLRLIDIHSKIVGASADDDVSAWQFREGTRIMDLMATLAAELQGYERLKRSKEYIDIVVDVEQTADQAKKDLALNKQSVLAACTHAFEILKTRGTQDLKERSSTARQPESHLGKYIRQSVQQIWEHVETAAGDALNKSLVKLGWPAKLNMSSTSAVVDFDAQFSTLMSLDHMLRGAEETLDRCRIDLQRGRASPLPLEYMARAVDIRMRYHFETARETNRADKPEWWLSQVLTTLQNIVTFLEAHVQWLYDGTASKHLDVRNEFIQLLLPIIRRKLAHDRSEYLRTGVIIPNVVRELAYFDHTLQQVYFFEGGSMLSEFLADGAVFDAWVEAERSAAISSYMNTVAEPGAFDPVYEGDGLDPDDPRPTLVSEKVVLLVEDIAERYAMVPSRMLQLQLLSTTQFPIVIALVEDVEAEIDEFSRVSLAFIRNTAGIPSVGAAGVTSTTATMAKTASAQSTFVSQLGRLISWYQTVWHVEESAREWNNSTVYVDMWAAVCKRAQAIGKGTDPRDWRENCDCWSIQDRRLLDDETESAADVISSHDDEDWLDGGIWERSTKTLGDLKQRILELVCRAINKETIDQMRSYRKKNNWETDGSFEDNRVSAELSNVLPELSLSLSSLSNTLPYAAFVRITRALGNELDTFLVERVACAHRFSIHSGRQFCRDIDALSRVLLSSAARTAFKTAARHPLPKARECGEILSCVVDSTASPPTSASAGISLSLEEWGPAVMDVAADDQETALVLNKLGIKHLSVKQVRRLVGNRLDYAQSTTPLSE
ncbi:hypothetical protein H4R99_006037 [Coemansia sp. RSA 1722]|nr:hypothetical protein H4R99_006037 [Coemansia sp. RSA 1722]